MNITKGQREEGHRKQQHPKILHSAPNSQSAIILMTQACIHEIDFCALILANAEAHSPASIKTTTLIYLADLRVRLD
jgi:hypothetical protein